ncbi:MAG TPA: outer membrane beta-barrel protein [Gemmatimonadaceae bacterium]
MSRKLLAAVAIAVCLPLSLASAQKIGFGAAAGLSAPMGDFGDAVDAGYNVTGILSLSLIGAPVGFRGEASYNSFNGKGVISGIKENITSGTVNVLFSPPLMGIYGIGGLGIYKPSCDGCGSLDSKVGFNVGAGYKLGLAGFSAFIEARYHTFSSNGSSTSYIPVVFGVTF